MRFIIKLDKYIKNIMPLFSYTVSYSVMSRLLFKTLMISIVLYECKTWCFTQREEHKVHVSEQKVFRKIYAPRWLKQMNRLWCYTTRNIVLHINYVVQFRRSGHKITIWEARYAYRTVGNVHLENEDEMRNISSSRILGRYTVSLQDRRSQLRMCRTAGFEC